MRSRTRRRASTCKYFQISCFLALKIDALIPFGADLALGVSDFVCNVQCQGKAKSKATSFWQHVRALLCRGYFDTCISCTQRVVYAERIIPSMSLSCHPWTAKSLLTRPLVVVNVPSCLWWLCQCRLAGLDAIYANAI